MSSLGLGLFSIPIKTAPGYSQYAVRGNLPWIKRMKEALGSAHCNGLVNHMASGGMKPFESLGPVLLSKEDKSFRRFGTQLNNFITHSNVEAEPQEDNIFYYSSEESDSSDGLGLRSRTA